MRVLSWSKNGWDTKQLQQEDKEIYSRIHSQDYLNAIGNDYQNVEYDNADKTFELFKKANSEFVKEEAIDALPASMRMLWESNDRFFVGDQGIFRKVDAIEQALDGEFGGFEDEREDEEVLLEEDENTSTVQKTEESVYAEQERLYESIISKYQAMAAEACEDDNNDIYELLAESENSSTIPEAAIDYAMNIKFGESEYYGPKEKVGFIDKGYFQASANAEKEKDDRFQQFFTRMSLCKTKVDLYGKRHFNKDTGETYYEGGILNTIRPLYQKDKEIRAEWTEEKRLEARSKFIEEWRKSTNELEDEATLKGQIAYRFDNTPVTIREEDKPIKTLKQSRWMTDKNKAFQELCLNTSQWAAIYKMKNVIVSQIRKNFEQCDERDNAIAILREGFAEIECIADLKSYIKEANHRQQKHYVKEIVPIAFTYETKDGQFKTSYSRHTISVKSYDFEPSLLDKISMNDKIKWQQAINNKKQSLIERARR